MHHDTIAPLYFCSSKIPGTGSDDQSREGKRFGDKNSAPLPTKKNQKNMKKIIVDNMHILIIAALALAIYNFVQIRKINKKNNESETSESGNETPEDTETPEE